MRIFFIDRQSTWNEVTMHIQNKSICFEYTSLSILKILTLIKLFPVKYIISFNDKINIHIYVSATPRVLMVKNSGFLGHNL